MGYNITPLTDENFSSLVDLLHQSFIIENPDKSGLVHWKLLHPFHRNRSISVVAVDDVGRVVGHYSNIPITLIHEKEEYPAMMCVDMSTHPHHRGKGLISQMASVVYSQVRQQQFALTIGFSNTDGLKVDTSSHGYGYTIVGPFTRYITVPLPHPSSSFSLMPTRFFSLPIPQSDPFPYVHIKKDIDYLTWRYLLRPHQDYVIYKIQQGELFRGYLIVRFIGRRCYVYDLCLATYQPAFLRQIFTALEQLLWKKGITLLVINVLNNHYWQSVFPRYRYWHTNRGGDAYYLTVKIHNEILPKAELLNKDHWFLVNGDIL